MTNTGANRNFHTVQSYDYKSIETDAQVFISGSGSAIMSVSGGAGVTFTMFSSGVWQITANDNFPLLTNCTIEYGGVSPASHGAAFQFISQSLVSSSTAPTTASIYPGPVFFGYTSGAVYQNPPLNCVAQVSITWKNSTVPFFA